MYALIGSNSLSCRNNKMAAQSCYCTADGPLNQSFTNQSIIYKSMTFKPTVWVGNHWLCQAPYGRPNVRNKTGQRWSWDSIEHRGMQRRNVLIGPCQINVACTSHKTALSRRSCLNWWQEEVRKRQRVIGRVCRWWCKTENWCWDGLTGSVSVHCKTVI